MRQSDNDISITSLIESLPSFDQGAFAPDYRDYSQIDISRSEGALLQQFDQDTFDARLDPGPYSYGAYFVYEANNSTKQFKVASFVNITS